MIDHCDNCKDPVRNSDLLTLWDRVPTWYGSGLDYQWKHRVLCARCAIDDFHSELVFDLHVWSLGTLQARCGGRLPVASRDAMARIKAAMPHYGNWRPVFQYALNNKDDLI